jgi:hypothetical protein
MEADGGDTVVARWWLGLRGLQRRQESHPMRSLFLVFYYLIIVFNFQPLDSLLPHVLNL